MFRTGDRVRILEIHETDDNPGCRPGDIVTLTANTLDAEPGGYGPGWIWIDHKGGLAVAKVDLVEYRHDIDDGAAAVDAALATEAPRPTPPVFMSTDSAIRKLMPVALGVLKYFPDAIMLCAWVSRAGNDKHNPGQPVHWAKEKSADEPDCEARHMLDFFREVPPDPGLEPLGRLGHLASKFWRAAAHLQRECDKERAAYEAALAEWEAKHGRTEPVG